MSDLTESQLKQLKKLAASPRNNIYTATRILNGKNPDVPDISNKYYHSRPDSISD